MFKNQIKLIAIIALLLNSFTLALSAQDTTELKFIDGHQLTVLGRNKELPANGYYRIDSADLNRIPRRVATLSSNSSGISVSFQTNSTSISIKWTLIKFNTLANMTPLSINGLDLYGWNGKYWQYVASAKPKGVNNEALVINHLDGQLRSYRFYLPLYAGVKDLQIGVEKSAVIKKEPPDFIPGKKVVIYGSSITQGTSASRPGMAYPSIAGRKLNIETFNMGFSGTGKMELPLADIIAKMDADVYILDCVPNPSPKQIHDRAVPFIHRLRNLKPGVPIIMVESIFREKGNWNSEKGDYVNNQNKEFRQAYDQLMAENFKQLYYVPSEGLIGDDHEATIDNTHLTDLGFTRFAKRIEAELREVFKIESVSLSGK
jgi:lysophospholipase L1-like esterase